MRIIVFIVAAVLVCQLASAVTQQLTGITSAYPSISAIGPGVYHINFHLKASVPSACVISQVNIPNTSGDLSPSSVFTPVSSTGVMDYIFNFIYNPGNYIVSATCTPTCGNGYCDNSTNDGGLEYMGSADGPTTDSQGRQVYACREDCGCGGGLNYGFNGAQYVCASPCQNVTSTVNSNYLTQGCTTNTGGMYSLNTSAVCQKIGSTTTYCEVCSPGMYMQAGVANAGCVVPITGDNICAYNQANPAIGESWTSSDCTKYCGDTSCEAQYGETATTCPADCGCADGQLPGECVSGTKTTCTGPGGLQKPQTCANGCWPAGWSCGLL